MIKKIEQKEVIKSYNEKHGLSNQFLPDDALYRWVLRKTNPKPGMALLDVACGMGMMVVCGEKQGLKSFGIDISFMAIQRAKKVFGLSRMSTSEGEKLPFTDNSFDLVTNLGSLEHFLSIEEGLSEMRRVVKKDGVVAIYLPNSYYLVDVLWEVGRKGYGPTHSQIIERFATFGEWRDLIEAHGLKVKQTYKYNLRFPITKTDWKFVMQRPQRLLKAMVAPFIPFNLSYSFLFICESN
ncbi:MAG: class I SAM-dependent methyltransferase [Anaerolineaceae bacterium]|nr:class I SAM-dependent methyltransferase [Anaerolineaceae bacterium]